MDARRELNTADLITEGRRLAPWHLLVEITPEVSTRDFADAPYPESFGWVNLIDPRERFTATLEKIYPDRLAGRSVLDCACNCGGFLFWARELGAGPCDGIDVRPHWIEQAQFLSANRTAASDDMRFETRDVYDLADSGLEPFDVVLFNGILYHLPDPIAGLKIAAELTRELLIINTSTTIGLPDGLLAASGESLTRPVSGVYGLNWFPTGPDVLRQMLAWLGFTEVRVNWWRRLPDQKPGHARLEMVAARDVRTLASFDAVEQQRSPLSRIVENAVPPEMTVLVASDTGRVPVEFHGRHAVPFPSNDAHAADADLIAELIRLRGEGAGYFLIPQAAAAWLSEHPSFHKHLHTYRRIVRDPDTAVLFSLLSHVPHQ
jgi:tRNA (mo5U34)-methyltransferase